MIDPSTGYALLVCVIGVVVVLVMVIIQWGLRMKVLSPKVFAAMVGVSAATWIVSPLVLRSLLNR